MHSTNECVTELAEGSFGQGRENATDRSSKPLVLPFLKFPECLGTRPQVGN